LASTEAGTRPGRRRAPHIVSYSPGCPHTNVSTSGPGAKQYLSHIYLCHTGYLVFSKQYLSHIQLRNSHKHWYIMWHEMKEATTGATEVATDATGRRNRQHSILADALLVDPTDLSTPLRRHHAVANHMHHLLLSTVRCFIFRTQS
jgi:hypothetical protein